MAAKENRTLALGKFLLSRRRALSARGFVYSEDCQPVIFIQWASLTRRVIAVVGTLTTEVVWCSFVLLMMFGAAFSGGPESKLRSFEAKALAMFWLGFFVVPIATMAVLKPRQFATLYRDETKAEKLLEIQNKKIPSLAVTYVVRDAAGEPLSLLRKRLFGKSWRSLTPDGLEVCVASLAGFELIGPSVAELRRRAATGEDWAGSPWSNPWAASVGSPGRISFRHGQQELGELTPSSKQYLLDLSADAQHVLDWRIAVALGLVIVAIEHPHLAEQRRP